MDSGEYDKITSYFYRISNLSDLAEVRAKIKRSVLVIVAAVVTTVVCSCCHQKFSKKIRRLWFRGEQKKQCCTQKMSGIFSPASEPRNLDTQ